MVNSFQADTQLLSERKGYFTPPPLSSQLTTTPCSKANIQWAQPTSAPRTGIAVDNFEPRDEVSRNLWNRVQKVISYKRVLEEKVSIVYNLRSSLLLLSLSLCVCVCVCVFVFRCLCVSLCVCVCLLHTWLVSS